MVDNKCALLYVKCLIFCCCSDNMQICHCLAIEKSVLSLMSYPFNCTVCVLALAVMVMIAVEARKGMTLVWVMESCICSTSDITLTSSPLAL